LTLTAVAMALVTAALAQPRGRGKPKPKPPVVADAGATDNASGESPAPAPAGSAAPSPVASPPSDGGAAATAAPAAPVARPEMSDGGVRPSPLNPTAEEMPTGGAGGGPNAADVDKLIGDIAALRARVAAVSDTLFHSRIALALQIDGDHGKVTRLQVSLDDGVVFTSQPGFRAEDMTAIYDHGVAPGRHAVTVDVERRDDRDETYRTWQRSRFVVEVPKDERLTVELRVGDDSTMGGDFPSDRSGRYDLRVRAKASSKPVGK